MKDYKGKSRISGLIKNYINKAFTRPRKINYGDIEIDYCELYSKKDVYICIKDVLLHILLGNGNIKERCIVECHYSRV